jgi:hypothetical protein
MVLQNYFIKTIRESKKYGGFLYYYPMYKSIQNIIFPPKNHPEENTEPPEPIEPDFYNELPLNYFKRDDNDSPDMDNVYSYKFNNKYRFREFSYLNDDELNKHYDYHENKKIYLCIYAFNDKCFFNREPYPFLQFLAQREDEKFTFPSFTFEYPPNIDDEDLQIHFTNNCLNKVIDFFVLEGSNLYKYATENMNRSYRGFIQHEDDIYVVYDMTNFINLKMRKTKRAEWCVLSELTTHSITSSSVVNFFQTYKYMTMIHSLQTIPQPVAMYLYNIDKREPITHITDLLEPRSFHPSYGNFYYFIETRPGNSHVKCAVFMENMVVIEGQVASSSDSDTDSLEYSDDSEQPLPFASIIQFIEDTKIYCVKTESLFTYLQN